MLKLIADDVAVESFSVQDADREVTPTFDGPTPATFCGWCPQPTFP